MSTWGLGVTGDLLSFGTVFGDSAFGDAATDVREVVLDIGFGSGEALIEVAERRPHECVVGIDVHTPGVAAVLEAIQRRGLRNVRVAEGDVVDLLARIPERSLAAIRVFFPDPWPKRRQRGRRLIRPEIVERLVPLMRIGGMLHLATDIDDYVAQMCAVCNAVPGLIGGVIERPTWRPLTRYERRAIDEGRRPVDLMFAAT